MFRKSTVFILGAGASWHYGYPTGEELVDRVLAKAKQLSHILEFGMGAATLQLPEIIRPAEPTTSASTNALAKPWKDGRAICKELIERIENARPLVIDYFLGLNREIEELGRFMIAWVILEHEYKSSDRSKWYRFIISQLVSGCAESTDLLRNQVNFVTFNYDTSLDRTLYSGLHAHSLFARTEIDEFLRNRVIHLYGSVTTSHLNQEIPDFSLLGGIRPDTWHRAKALLDLIYSAAQGIQVIAPREKCSDDFQRAFGLIDSANVVYILGYGFDEINSRRLGLRTSLGSPNFSMSRSVLITNFQNSNRINKRISRLFFGHPNAFIDRDIVDATSSHLPYFEKSARDVYGALALDFDALED